MCEDGIEGLPRPTSALLPQLVCLPGDISTHNWVEIHYHVKYIIVAISRFYSRIGENGQLVTDEKVEVQDCRKITDNFRGIYGIYPI